MKFSERTAWPKAANRLALLAETLRKTNRPFIDLTQSNPTNCLFKTLESRFLKPLADPANLFYKPDPRGHRDARLAVCRYYADKKINIHPDRVVLTSSTSEAYTFLFRLLLDPKDKIAFPAPSYPLLDLLSQLNDAEGLRYRLLYEKKWQSDPGGLDEALKKGSKAICVVNPNNPTGNFITEEEKKELSRQCASNGCAIISDEVFFDYRIEEGPAEPVSFAGNEEALTFVLSGISKILGLPQMKVSWIVVSGPESLAAEALRRLEIVADTYLSVNTPAQTALGSWLEKYPAINQEISKRVTDNYFFLKQTQAGSAGLQVLNSEGGWVAILRSDLGMDDEKLALTLLEKADVLVHPGYFYDFEKGDYLVLSLLPPPEHFKEAIKRIKGAV